MNKSQAENESFQARTASFSTHSSRTGVNLLGWEEDEVLTPQQQREALVRAKQSVEEQLRSMNEEMRQKLPFKVVQIKAAQRAELKARATDIETRLREMALAKPVKYPDMGECIIDAIRVRMTKPQWECILAEAHQRFKAANGYAYQGGEYK